MNELKPCPFCGVEAEIIRAVKEICWCKCKKCDVSMPATFNEQNAIEKWNRRVDDDKRTGHAERLECIITNDRIGKTLLINDGKKQFTISFEAVEKYLR